MNEADFHYYEPSQGHGLAHDPFNAIVGPRPIGWISSLSAEGVVNLAPYSFFNAFNYAPPIVGFCSVGWKDTAANVAATREFVWNLATLPLAQAMSATSAMAAPGINEFDLAGLAAAPCRLVAPPRVALSPVAFECRLTQMHQLSDAAGKAVPSWLMLGEVVAVHIHRALLAQGHYDTAAAQPILRGGGPAEYFTITADQRFSMERPR